jgi:hypothetical protein
MFRVHYAQTRRSDARGGEISGACIRIPAARVEQSVIHQLVLHVSGEILDEHA